MKVVLAGIWLISVAAAFYYGSRVGVREYSLADAHNQAAITVGNLRLIENNRVSDLQGVLNLQLDSALARHADYMDSNWKWLWPEANSVDPHIITFAASYRASHPYAWPELSPAGDDVKAGAEQVHSKVQRVVKEYAK